MAAARTKAAAAAVVFTALTLVAVAGADRLLGLVVPDAWLSRSLVFPPNVRFTMSSADFSCEVRTNELGFRGGPVPPPSPDRVRIVAIGDSFTYGWGVEVEQAWPARLEARLRELGFDTEVLNLGSPGAGPNEYADVAERALPVLKPNLVVVGLLQGDDLLQSGDTGAVPTGRPPSSRTTISTVATTLFPTLVGIVQSARERARRGDADARILAALDQSFRDGAAAAIASFTPEEKKRYDALDEPVRRMFESGGVNPALVALAIRQPDYFLSAAEGDEQTLEPHGKAMVKALERVRTAAEGVGARAMVVGVPYPAYVNVRQQKRLRRLGFHLPSSARQSVNPDRMVGELVRKAGLDVTLYATAAFRRDPAARKKYFPWDNHFTPAGHDAFARLVAERVLANLPKQETPAHPPVHAAEASH